MYLLKYSTDYKLPENRVQTYSLDALCLANRRLVHHPSMLNKCLLDKLKNEGQNSVAWVGSCPHGCERTCPSSLPPEWAGSGGSGDEATVVAGFQFLIITSLFSGILMFSVTCTFSHCDLALILRKQSGFSLTFSFCLWRILLLENSAHLWLKEKKLWLPYWQQCTTVFFLPS